MTPPTPHFGLAATLIALVAFCSGCDTRPPDHKIHVTYWEKWTGAEADAMQRTVDAFNQSQDKILVEFLSVPSVNQKTLLATAGGDPPDVAGLWVSNAYAFADCNALMPIDDLIRADGMTKAQWLERYYPVYADLSVYRDRIWGVPSTITTTALYWNKALFRAAGLDPEIPPRTLAELDEFAERLTKRDARGALTQLGFLPQEPGWYHWAFPLWFGGALWDDREITAARPENMEAYHWVQSYTQKYGLNAVRNFSAGSGDFASPQNPFFSNRLAMVIQGVWMNNYIRQFAPGMEYGVGPWPTVKPGLENFTVADADFLAIPRGAKHPREAWEFIKYVSSNNPAAQTFEELKGMELLCFLQQKNSPLRQWSPFFETHHPNPNIALFRRLEESRNAVHGPKIGIWEQYLGELGNVFDRVRLLTATPEEALQFCQQRVDQNWGWHRASLKRRGLWNEQTAQINDVDSSVPHLENSKAP